MAQTKRKRRTKHRGNAAGTIETRGRTGRPLSPEEKKRQSRVDARERRLNTPPTWKASMQRAALAAVLMFLFLSFFTHTKNRVVSGALFAVLAFLLYVPAGYYMEVFLWRRRQRRKQVGR